uniref:Uncharacterized protein MANES_S021700 n=1 Tax=Rhizophora mucronata TaxID=61149 RepID=A0A2P2J2D0_RHIMU
MLQKIQLNLSLTNRRSAQCQIVHKSTAIRNLFCTSFILQIQFMIILRSHW